MSTTPTEVAKQAADADAIIADLAGGKAPEKVETPVVETVTDDSKVTSREVISALTNLDTPTVNKEDDPEYWKSRFQVVEGLLNKAKEGSEDAVAELERENERLKNRIDAKPTEGKTYLSDEDREELGEELAPIVDSAIAKGVDEAVRQSTEVSNVTLEKIEKKSIKLETDAYFDALDTKAPKWENLNRDEGFNEWLNEYDPMLGATRRDSLSIAEKQKDGERVAAFFSAYEVKVGKTVVERPNPEDKIIPAGSRASEVPDSSGKRIYTHGEIKAIYDDITAGKYSPEEASRLDADIIAAAGEGRIT